MKAQNVCCCCGRTIENSFVYCPWCGKEVITPSKAQLFEEPIFERIEFISDDVREQRIFKIEYSLNQLEEDLSRMLADCQK
ncbi:MAG: hypothetical protein MJ159_05485 [Treponemataceae bacterium]|nr:hypothetical protein [Treponemataceae bacterium]